MKAIQRCKSDHQGDRCKKAKDHDSSFGLEPDPVHLGNFASWNEQGVILQLRPEAPKRHRRLFKMLRNIDMVEPKVRVAFLTEAVKYLRGSR